MLLLLSPGDFGRGCEGEVGVVGGWEEGGTGGEGGEDLEDLGSARKAAREGMP